VGHTFTISKNEARWVTILPHLCSSLIPLNGLLRTWETSLLFLHAEYLMRKRKKTFIQHVQTTNFVFVPDTTQERNLFQLCFFVTRSNICGDEVQLMRTRLQEEPKQRSEKKNAALN
jgi:hypothetical protein